MEWIRNVQVLSYWLVDNCGSRMNLTFMWLSNLTYRTSEDYLTISTRFVFNITFIIKNYISNASRRDFQFLESNENFKSLCNAISNCRLIWKNRFHTCLTWNWKITLYWKSNIKLKSNTSLTVTVTEVWVTETPYHNKIELFHFYFDFQSCWGNY